MDNFIIKNSINVLSTNIIERSSRLTVEWKFNVLTINRPGSNTFPLRSNGPRTNTFSLSLRPTVLHALANLKNSNQLVLENIQNFNPKDEEDDKEKSLHELKSNISYTRLTECMIKEISCPHNSILIVLCKEELSWDTILTKQFILVIWTKKFIEEKPGNFLSTKEIFDMYKDFFNSENQPHVLLPEASFYKEVYSALLGAKIIYAKSRKEGKRGISGIQFKKNQNLIFLNNSPQEKYSN